jgi:hypothetical protein
MGVNNKADKIELLKIYRKVLTQENGIILCMMGEEVSRYNPFTVHHIVPIRDGGSNQRKNKSLLSHIAHIDFNLIEIYKPKEAQELTDGIIDFKKTRNPAIPLQLKSYKDFLLLDIDCDLIRQKQLILKR